MTDFFDRYGPFLAPDKEPGDKEYYVFDTHWDFSCTLPTHSKAQRLANALNEMAEIKGDVIDAIDCHDAKELRALVVSIAKRFGYNWEE